MLRMASNYNHS